jgi:hypothetical protein
VRDETDPRFDEALRLRDAGELEASLAMLLALIPDLANDDRLLAHTHLQCSHLLELLGRELPEAEAHCRAAVRITPNLELASLCLLVVLDRLGRRKEALKEMVRFLRIRDSEEHRRVLSRAAPETGGAERALAEHVRRQIDRHLRERLRDGRPCLHLRNTVLFDADYHDGVVAAIVQCGACDQMLWVSITAADDALDERVFVGCTLDPQALVEARRLGSRQPDGSLAMHFGARWRDHLAGRRIDVVMRGHTLEEPELSVRVDLEPDGILDLHAELGQLASIDEATQRLRGLGVVLPEDWE